jgi:hypothetical protein
MIHSRISPALRSTTSPHAPDARRRDRPGWARTARHRLGRPIRLEADRLAGRALARQPRDLAALGDRQRRQARRDRVEDVRVRAVEVVQREPQQLDRRAVLRQQRLAVPFRRQRREREHDGQVVGQLGRVHRQPGGAVELLEPQQRHAALARVAVGVIAEVQAGAAAQVEGLHVTRRQRRLAPAEAGQEAPKRRAGRAGRQRRHLGGELVARADDLGPRVAQQEGQQRPGRGRRNRRRAASEPHGPGRSSRWRMSIRWKRSPS